MYKDWNFDMIGVIATEEDVQKRSIIINQKNSIQFYVKVISAKPYTFPKAEKAEWFTCYSNDLVRYGFEDNPQLPDEERKEMLMEFLEDYLIVFRPHMRVVSKPSGYNEVYVCKDVRLLRKASNYVIGSKFIIIPLFSREYHDVKRDYFIEKLLTNKYVGRIENISTDVGDTPPYIIWKNEDHFEVIGEFESHQYGTNGFCFYTSDGGLKITPLREEWLSDCYSLSTNPTLLYMPLEVYRAMTSAIADVEPIYYEEEEQSMPFARAQIASTSALLDEPVTHTPAHDPLHGANYMTTSMAQALAQANLFPGMVETELPLYQDTVMTHQQPLHHQPVLPPQPQAHQPNALQPQPRTQSAPREQSSPLQHHQEEIAFMNHFINVTHEMGLLYDEKDLYNFHTAMKSNSLNIIAGMSGTGKSRLVQSYARALGLSDTQFVTIPVRPSWTDDADLLGYVDAMNMVYRPGDSGLINTLIEAQKEENRTSKLYLVCFDEMNLARVEHYFSQFLSVLEMEPGRRTLRLYNDDLEGRLYNHNEYQPVITIPENILFVGTVNIDESTYHFSDKVLDRANVIALRVLPYKDLKNLLTQDKYRQNQEMLPTYTYSYEQYRSFRKNDDFVLTDRETEFFWAIHKALQTSSRMLGVGPRVVKQIELYIRNLPVNPFLSRQEALDLQVVQRILTKLRGSEGLLLDLLGRASSAGDVQKGALIERLNAFSDVSEFTETRNVIQHKAKELRLNGYTI